MTISKNIAEELMIYARFFVDEAYHAVTNPYIILISSHHMPIPCRMTCDGGEGVRGEEMVWQCEKIYQG